MQLMEKSTHWSSLLHSMNSMVTRGETFSWRLGIPFSSSSSKVHPAPHQTLETIKTHYLLIPPEFPVHWLHCYTSSRCSRCGAMRNASRQCSYVKFIIDRQAITASAFVNHSHHQVSVIDEDEFDLHSRVVFWCRLSQTVNDAAFVKGGRLYSFSHKLDFMSLSFFTLDLTFTLLSGMTTTYITV